MLTLPIIPKTRETSCAAGLRAGGALVGWGRREATIVGGLLLPSPQRREPVPAVLLLPRAIGVLARHILAAWKANHKAFSEIMTACLVCDVSQI